MSKLSPTMQAALDILIRDGVIYMGNGVSLATVLALQTRGLATVQTSVRSEVNRQSNRTHAVRDWVAWPTRLRKQSTAKLIADIDAALAVADEIMNPEDSAETCDRCGKTFDHTDVNDGYLGLCANCADDDESESENSADADSDSPLIIPITDIPRMCVCTWWIPTGATMATRTHVGQDCTVHGSEVNTQGPEEESGNVLTESARAELRELLSAWEEVAHPDHISFYDQSRALAEAVASLIGTELSA